MKLLIHAGIKLNHVSKRSSRYSADYQVTLAFHDIPLIISDSKSRFGWVDVIEMATEISRIAAILRALLKERYREPFIYIGLYKIGAPLTNRD